MTRNSIAAPLARERLFNARVQLSVSVALLAGLAACAGPTSQVPATEEAAQYREHARHYYQPPGPAWDPWGPYVKEASARFDVPESWIRAVMHQESGGHEFAVSTPGAMGLMQLMPMTYDELREQDGLGDDPYDPHSNVLAGTAYLRQMYDIYGSPGFLAAYDAGPGRLEDYLTHDRPLPAETRQYVAIIGRQIAFDSPRNRSQADLMALNHVRSEYEMARNDQQPTDPALTRSVRLAWARRTNEASSETVGEVAELASAPITRPERTTSAVRVAWAQRGPTEPAYVPARSVWNVMRSQPTGSDMASRPSPELANSVAEAPEVAVATPPRRIRFHLVNPAMAETMRWHAAEVRDASTTGNWSIQIGAFGSVIAAGSATGSARVKEAGLLGHARVDVATVQKGRGNLYRARFVRLSRAAAEQACEHLGHNACMVISPEGSL